MLDSLQEGRDAVRLLTDATTRSTSTRGCRKGFVDSPINLGGVPGVPRGVPRRFHAHDLVTWPEKDWLKS